MSSEPARHLRDARHIPVGRQKHLPLAVLPSISGRTQKATLPPRAPESRSRIAPEWALEEPPSVQGEEDSRARRDASAATRSPDAFLGASSISAATHICSLVTQTAQSPHVLHSVVQLVLVAQGAEPPCPRVEQ